MCLPVSAAACQLRLQLWCLGHCCWRAAVLVGQRGVSSSSQQQLSHLAVAVDSSLQAAARQQPGWHAVSAQHTQLMGFTPPSPACECQFPSSNYPLPVYLEAHYAGSRPILVLSPGAEVCCLGCSPRHATRQQPAGTPPSAHCRCVLPNAAASLLAHQLLPRQLCAPAAAAAAAAARAAL